MKVDDALKRHGTKERLKFRRDAREQRGKAGRERNDDKRKRKRETVSLARRWEGGELNYLDKGDTYPLPVNRVIEPWTFVHCEHSKTLENHAVF